MRVANRQRSCGLGLLVLALACGSGDQADQEEAATGASGSTRGRAAADDARPFVGFPAAGVPNTNPDSSMVRERGIGVLGFDPGPLLAGRVADSLEVWADTTPNASVLARLVLDTTSVYRYEAREGLLEHPGALEFGYEEVGLPVLERRPDGWVRLYLGDAPGAVPVSGWSRARPGVLGLTLWEDLLPGQPLFFALPPDSIRFHASREGPEEPFPVGNGYIMWPLETSGDWMRVRAVAPSNYCFVPLSPRQDTLWIRWRDERARPRVWFYTRGC